MPLIPTNIWCNTTSTTSQSSLLCNIYWGKHYIFPATLSRTKGYTTTIFRLPRRIYKMKYSIIIRGNNIICWTINIYLHYMRSICCPTKSNCKIPYNIIPRMKRYATPRLPQSSRNRNNYRSNPLILHLLSESH